MLLKHTQHVLHDYFSSFNQQSDYWFLALSLPLPSSLFELPSVQGQTCMLSFSLSRMKMSPVINFICPLQRSFIYYTKKLKLLFSVVFSFAMILWIRWIWSLQGVFIVTNCDFQSWNYFLCSEFLNTSIDRKRTQLNRLQQELNKLETNVHELKLQKVGIKLHSC